jgi:hypothetical protein
VTGRASKTRSTARRSADANDEARGTRASHRRPDADPEIVAPLVRLNAMNCCNAVATKYTGTIVTASETNEG